MLMPYNMKSVVARIMAERAADGLNEIVSTNPSVPLTAVSRVSLRIFSIRKRASYQCLSM